MGLKASYRGTGLWASRPPTGVKAFGPQGPEVVRVVMGVYRPKKINYGTKHLLKKNRA